ncbi:unnamed protein product [Paramecium pentaurelia]|uniref:Uncharacterized protein n=1 Tax=Paramecium pentaurelia TaxID=43138 RepID=A0A8S1XPP5_9CILI|nr:unnamed protein product [Paramecium pentaurelia]
MKILIINGYGKSYKGMKNFEQYKLIIKEALLSKKEMIDTEIDFIIRDRDSIDDLLYEIDSSFVRVECGKMFDSIDIIFFEGDANLRPWSPNAYKYLIFLRMCLRSNKILFASSFAMQGLVFLIASNVECQISVINGLNGGQLGDLSKIKKDLTDIKQTDFFLDNVTGDLYGFNYDTGEWVSKGNAGIHFRKAAEEFKTIGKYIMKAPQYKVKGMKELDALYVSKENEIVCSLRKNQMHHFLFNDVPFEFVVPYKNSWDVHPFNFVNPKKTFQTLADCTKGPLIIQISDNIIGTQFAIKRKYKDTTVVLKNLMGYQLTKLCSGQAHSIPIEIASIKQNDNAMDIFLEHMSKNKYQAHQKTIKFNVITEFHHAGYAAKKSDKLDVVVNNAIGKRRFKQQIQKLPSKELDKILSNDNSYRQTARTSNNQSRKFVSFTNTQNGLNSPLKGQTLTQFDDQIEQKPQFHKTSGEIMKLLHPSIDDSLVESNNKQMWVPGFLSQNRGIKLSNHNPKECWNQKLNLRKPFQNPLQIETQFDNIYKTQKQLELEEEREKNKKIIGTKQFRCGTPAQSNLITTYISRNQSVPQHQFRMIEKVKWISPQDFKV